MYSQNLEDQIITAYFKDHVGTFLDIGANDGITFSNVRKLAELGWSGVCVEPSPKAYERLRINYKEYPNVYTYPFMIGTSNKDVPFNESGALVSSSDVALVSTAIDEEMDRFKRTVKYEKITVKSFRWKTFLNRLRIKEFDFVSLDVEGMELVILDQMDLSDVKCICVEWNGKNKDKFDLHMKDFKLIYTSAENLIYAR
jgi:FkbM family methyltransferase